MFWLVFCIVFLCVILNKDSKDSDLTTLCKAIVAGLFAGCLFPFAVLFALIFLIFLLFG